MSMLRLDHLVVLAPTLEEGVAHVHHQLGIEMSSGGEHPLMGTHNRLLRLGDDAFLEVLAINPTAKRPDRARWFGLEDAEAVAKAWNEGRRLRAWVARATHDLDDILVRHGAVLGEKVRVSRGDRSWDLAVRRDGALPMDGAVPPIINWGERGNPAPDMPEQGVRLQILEVEHPNPDEILAFYNDLNIENAPRVRLGERVRFRAIFNTPAGSRELF